MTAHPANEAAPRAHEGHASREVPRDRPSGALAARAPEVSDVVLSVPALTLSWVIRLRWGAVLGQTFTITVVATALQVSLPLGRLFALVGSTALTNVALTRFARRRPDSVTPDVLAGVLALDTLILCGLLYLTGGPSNPFSVLYLVQVTLAALVLGIGWASAIVALSAASYAFLFFANVPLSGVTGGMEHGMEAMDHAAHMGHAHHATSAFSLHLQGMWAAFTVAAALIAYFVTKVARALRQRDALLERVQQHAARTERLASLSTLAAGAAHELGTPLATIAVAAKELLRATESLPEGHELRQDVTLIREQIARCRTIVQQMGAHAGELMGEIPEEMKMTTLRPLLAARLSDDRVARLAIEDGSRGDVLLVAPPQGLAQVLGNLLNNAFDASGSKPVTFRVVVEPARVVFTVEDRGVGMKSTDLARVGEPFFTTKAPGAGMGLGLFLAHAFVERLGGALRLAPAPEGGTCATMVLPRALVARAPREAARRHEAMHVE